MHGSTSAPVGEKRLVQFLVLHRFIVKLWLRRAFRLRSLGGRRGERDAKDKAVKTSDRHHFHDCPRSHDKAGLRVDFVADASGWLQSESVAETIASVKLVRNFRRK